MTASDLSLAHCRITAPRQYLLTTEIDVLVRETSPAVNRLLAELLSSIFTYILPSEYSFGGADAIVNTATFWTSMTLTEHIRIGRFIYGDNGEI